MGMFGDLRYHYGNKYGPWTEPEDEIEDLMWQYPPLYYRFHRHIPRSRLWF